MKSVTTTSRTLAALTARFSYSALQRPASSALSQREFTQLKSEKHQLDLFDDGQAADSQQLLQALQQLDQSLVDGRNAGLFKREQRNVAIEIADILPVELGQEKQLKKETNSSDSQLTTDGLSIQERLVKYRSNPELYQKAVRDAQQARDAEFLKRKNEELEERKQHRRMMGDHSALVEDFVKFNKYQITHSKLTQAEVMRTRELSAALSSARCESAWVKRKYNEETRKNSSYLAYLRRAEPEKMLPRIYTQQKLKLGVMLYFAARFCAISKRAVEFEVLDTRNRRLSNAASTIYQYMRTHKARRDFLHLRRCALLCYYVGRFYLTRKNSVARKKCLVNMRYLLLDNYWQYTSLGAVSKFFDCKTYLYHQLQQYDDRMQARAHLLKMRFKACFSRLALDEWTTQRTKELAAQREKLRSNPKRHKEYKAFIAEHPEGAAVTPKSKEDNDNLLKRIPTDEQLDRICLYTLYALQKECQGDLDHCFIQNSSPAQLNALVYNLFCSADYMRQAYFLAVQGFAPSVAPDASILERPPAIFK